MVLVVGSLFLMCKRKSMFLHITDMDLFFRFFGFGGGGKKKSCVGVNPGVGGVGKRRGSDRSLTGAAQHDIPPTFSTPHVPLSTSQSNLHELPLK